MKLTQISICMLVFIKHCIKKNGEAYRPIRISHGNQQLGFF